MNLVAVLFNQGSTLIINIIVARILMKQSFGEYSMVYGTLLTAATLSQFAAGGTAAKYIAEFRSSDPERVNRIMGVCAILSGAIAGVGAILLVALAPWLAGTMLNAPHLTVPLIIGSGFLFFSAINGYQTGALAGLEAFGSLAKAGMASAIVALVAVSLGASWAGLNGCSIGLGVAALLRCVIHNRWLHHECRRQKIKPQYRGSLKSEKGIIYRFAVPAAMGNYYSMPLIWLANSLLVRQPGGYGEMALYSASNNLRLLALFLPNVMFNVAVSILNNEKSKGDRIHYRKTFVSYVLYIFIASLGGVIIIGIMGRPMLQLFGKDFGAGHFILWLLLVASLFEGLSIALYQYIQNRAKIWLSFFLINMPREACLVVAAYFLVRPYGGVGLAVAFLASTLLGLFFHLSIVATLYRKEIRADTFAFAKP